MDQAIAICTHITGREFLSQLLGSLSGCKKYPIIIVANGNIEETEPEWFEHLKCWAGHEPWSNFFKDGAHIYYSEDDSRTLVTLPWDGWEIGTIEAVYRYTLANEFWMFQDTWEVLNPGRFFDIVFEKNRGRTVALNKHFQMYAAKYRRAVLLDMDYSDDIPRFSSKKEAVGGEGWWTNLYKARAATIEKRGAIIIDNKFRAGTKKINRFGRDNMVTENDLLRKWKGTWQDNLAARLHEIDVEGKV